VVIYKNKLSASRFNRRIHYSWLASITQFLAELFSEGVPVSFALIEGAHHDLTAIHELCFILPEGAKVYGDKASNSADDEATMLQDTGVELIPIRRKNMTTQNTLAESFVLQRYRHQIEMLNSQLEHMGLQRLKARTNPGFFIKRHASLLALLFSSCTSK
jgi:hypothetical protein